MVTFSRNHRGYTLIELLITVGVLSILAVVGAGLMIQLQRNIILSRARVELQREARTAIDNITKVLRQTSAASITIDQVSGQPPYSRITCSNPEVSGQTIQIFQNNKTLTMDRGGQGDLILTSNLRYIAFSFPRSDDMGIVSVSLTLEKTIFEGRTKALHVASEKVQIMND